MRVTKFIFTLTFVLSLQFSTTQITEDTFRLTLATNAVSHFLLFSRFMNSATQQEIGLDFFKDIKAFSESPEMQSACADTCNFTAFHFLMLWHDEQLSLQYFKDTVECVPQCDWSRVNWKSGSHSLEEEKVCRILNKHQLFELFVSYLFQVKLESVEYCHSYKLLVRKSRGLTLDCHTLCLSLYSEYHSQTYDSNILKKCQPYKGSSELDAVRSLASTAKYVFNRLIERMFDSYNDFWWALYKFRVAQLLLTTDQNKLGSNYPIVRKDDENAQSCAAAKSVDKSVTDDQCRRLCSLFTGHFGESVPLLNDYAPCKIANQSSSAPALQNHASSSEEEDIYTQRLLAAAFRKITQAMESIRLKIEENSLDIISSRCKKTRHVMTKAFPRLSVLPCAMRWRLCAMKTVIPS